MRISVSSIIISVIVAAFLIIILRILLLNKLTYRQFRIDFLTIFSFIITIRLFLPFEFVNTRTFASKNILPTIYSIGKTNLGSFPFKISIGQIIFGIWLVGFFIKLGTFLIDNYQLKKIVHSLTNVPNDLLDPTISSMIPQNVKMYYSDIPSSPYSVGILKPGIVFSDLDLDVKTQQFIVAHELKHIRNFDNLKKYFIEFLVCIYWWFPLIYLFRKEVDSIIEINVDYQMVKNKPSDVYFQYTDCLIAVAKKLEESIVQRSDYRKNYSNIHYSNFVIFEGNTLTRRINFLLEEYPVRPTPWILKILLIVLPLMITSVIVEPYYSNTRVTKGTFQIPNDKTDTYILKEKNTYHLILKGKDLGEIKNFSSVKKDNYLKSLPVRVKK